MVNRGGDAEEKGNKTNDDGFVGRPIDALWSGDLVRPRIRSPWVVPLTVANIILDDDVS